MKCGRCETQMQLKWGSYTYNGLAVSLFEGEAPNHPRPVIYACPACGDIKLAPAEMAKKIVTTSEVKVLTKQETVDDQIRIDTAENKAAINIDDILKLIPGKSDIDYVYEKIGYPFAVHESDLGHVLCFLSAEKRFPHVVLIAPIYKLVKMVAIHNDHQTFPLEKLENVYGSRELAAQINYREHWLFDEPGVGFLAEERSDHNILYLQYFEPRISFNQYLELDGFSEVISDGIDDE